MRETTSDPGDVGKVSSTGGRWHIKFTLITLAKSGTFGASFALASLVILC